MRAILVVCLAQFYAVHTAGAQTDPVNDMTGVTSVNVVVEYVNSTAQTAGVSADALSALAARRLQAAAVPASEVGATESGTMLVAVSMTDMPGGGGVFAYRWDVSVVRLRSLAGDRVMEPVWKCDGIATTVTGGQQRVYDAVGTCVDRFAEEWRRVNGKPTP